MCNRKSDGALSCWEKQTDNSVFEISCTMLSSTAVPLIKSNKAAVSLVFRLAAPRTNCENKITKTGIKVGDSVNRTVLKVKKLFRLFVLINDTCPQCWYWYCSPYIIKKKNKTKEDYCQFTIQILNQMNSDFTENTAIKPLVASRHTSNKHVQKCTNNGNKTNLKCAFGNSSFSATAKLSLLEMHICCRCNAFINKCDIIFKKTKNNICMVKSVCNRS